MKRMMSLAAAIAVASPAYAIDGTVGRRGFLGGAAALFGGFTGRAAPVPAVKNVTEASAPLQAARAERVHSLLSDAAIFNVQSDGAHSHFSPHEIDVVRDWLAQSPEARKPIAGKLARMLEVDQICSENSILSGRDFGTEKWNNSSKAYSEASAERGRLKMEIRDAIDEWPWSSLSWPEVFSPSVAKIENEVARELGGVDVGRVHQLTEHALTTNGTAARPGAHLFALLAKTGRTETPLYSKHAVDVLVRSLRGSLPTLAEKIEFLNDEKNIDRANVRLWLVKSSQFFQLNIVPHLPVEFVFDRFEFYRGTENDPVEMAPYYARGLLHFERLRVGLARLGPSPLKTIALEELDGLELALREELRTLPERLRWFHERFSSAPRESGAKPVASHWTELAADPAFALDPAALLRWSQALEGLSVTAPSLAPLAEECALRLSESAPLQIEAKPDESLSLDEVSEGLPLRR